MPCPNCGSNVASARLDEHVKHFCENPYFVAARRMIRKYRSIAKYARPWAENAVGLDGDEEAHYSESEEGD